MRMFLIFVMLKEIVKKKKNKKKKHLDGFPNREAANEKNNRVKFHWNKILFNILFGNFYFEIPN